MVLFACAIRINFAFTLTQNKIALKYAVGQCHIGKLVKLCLCWMTFGKLFDCCVVVVHCVS